MFKMKKITSTQLKNIIEQRLSMQSTRRTLFDQYCLKSYDLNYFNSQEFNDTYSKWNDEKKKKFLGLVAGAANLKWAAELNKVVFGRE